MPLPRWHLRNDEALQNFFRKMHVFDSELPVVCILRCTLCTDSAAVNEVCPVLKLRVRDGLKGRAKRGKSPRITGPTPAQGLTYHWERGAESIAAPILRTDRRRRLGFGMVSPVR